MLIRGKHKYVVVLCIVTAHIRSIRIYSA